MEIASKDTTISVSADTFTGCWLFHIVGGAGWGTYRWFCPGIGNVRNESYVCYGTHSYVTVYDLASYYVVGSKTDR